MATDEEVKETVQAANLDCPRKRAECKVKESKIVHDNLVNDSDLEVERSTKK